MLSKPILWFTSFSVLCSSRQSGFSEFRWLVSMFTRWKYENLIPRTRASARFLQIFPACIRVICRGEARRALGTRLCKRLRSDLIQAFISLKEKMGNGAWKGSLFASKLIVVVSQNEAGLRRESNPWPPAPEARIIPLDHWASHVSMLTRKAIWPPEMWCFCFLTEVMVLYGNVRCGCKTWTFIKGINFLLLKKATKGVSFTFDWTAMYRNGREIRITISRKWSSQTLKDQKNSNSKDLRSFKNSKWLLRSTWKILDHSARTSSAKAGNIMTLKSKW